MDKTGVVLNIKGKKACIMTGDGEFVSVVIKGEAPLVGEVYSAPLAVPAFSVRRMAAAAALIFAVLTGGLTYTYNVEAASIIFEGNPEIKLGLNRWNMVIKAEGLNDDGRKVLSSISVKNKPLNTALGTIVDEAKKENLIVKEDKSNLEKKENVNILVDDKKEKVTSDINEFKEEMKKNNLDVTIGVQKEDTKNSSKKTEDNKTNGTEANNAKSEDNSAVKQDNSKAADKTHNGNSKNRENKTPSNKASVDNKKKSSNNDNKENLGDSKKNKK